jgi:hypothetical protein
MIERPARKDGERESDSGSHAGDRPHRAVPSADSQRPNAVLPGERKGHAFNVVVLRKQVEHGLGEPGAEIPEIGFGAPAERIDDDGESPPAVKGRSKCRLRNDGGRGLLPRPPRACHERGTGT